MSLTIWGSLFVVCLLGAMSPGASLAMVARHSLGGGRLHGVVTAWSHALGVGFYALLTVSGLAVLLHHTPWLFHTISYLGAAYLIWLGIGALRSKGGIAEHLESGRHCSLGRAARDGLMISLINPKLILFFLALFSQFVAAGAASHDHAIVIGTPLLVDGLWYTLIAMLLSHPRVLEVLRAKAVWIDRLCGLVLILVALRVVWPV
ncbi:LysE family translocator [Dongshaea marina]|uniref:LysE family translocator n=1 Tax=Dongshaea marina TaxID=2047966 RepID=UPI000D3E1242|nr:LysE family translocator [Dongshaea marina]